MCLFARVVTINTRESALTKKNDFRHSKGAYRFALKIVYRMLGERERARARRSSYCPCPCPCWLLPQAGVPRPRGETRREWETRGLRFTPARW
jgi:hypothetical protein